MDANETEYLFDTLLGARVSQIESLNQVEAKCWPIPEEESLFSGTWDLKDLHDA